MSRQTRSLCVINVLLRLGLRICPLLYRPRAKDLIPHDALIGEKHQIDSDHWRGRFHRRERCAAFLCQGLVRDLAR